MSDGRRRLAGDGGGGNRSVAERLHRCHDKIRAFLDLAEKVAARDGQPEVVEEGAADVGRYFGSAFQEHVEDENVSVFPRLAARADLALPLADRAIAEHVRDDLLVRELTSLSLAIAEQRATAQTFQRLADVVKELGPRLRDHLEFEEELLFPMLADLPPEEERAIKDEMRARRDGRP
jgi:iron-sulfur cluster repair protein YtfE (RIC family)